MAWTLITEGHVVEVAADGREALETLESHSPDLVLLDLNLPEMDGRAVFGYVRQAGYAGPIAICSAFGASQARRELGADGALSKPFQPEALVSLVERLVDGEARPPQPLR